jgi:hypothetical protein
MADFVAVLRKTIDGLGDTTPEMRTKVYNKARATVDAKLAAISPPPPPSVAARQKRTLEDAIEKVEADYTARRAAPPASDPLAELENVFAALKAKPAAPAPVAEPKSWTPPASKPEPAPVEPARVEPARLEPDRVEPQARDEEFNDFAVSRPEEDEAYAEADASGAFVEPPARRRGYGGLIVGLIALIVLGGGGYAVWLNKDDFSKLLGIGGGQHVATTEPAQSTPASKPETGKPETAKPEPATPSATTPEGTDAGAEPQKFTQRLNANGSETDEGPAKGEAGVGEGTSVAAATQQPQAPAAGTSPDDATPGDGAASTAEGATPSAEGTAPADAGSAEAGAAIAVGQKAIYYEERTSSSAGSADAGSIVWSVVQESPGADLPPEPAIRGEATVPGKDLQLRMTIKRNADKSLPASHIIELIFLTPDNFAGGGIDNILRFAMKDTEEAAGSPLIGIPAKIADGFFLVALNDSKAEIEANMTLLRRQDWIDVPVIYKSGRRALITMEKGVPGEKVFDEVMKAWQSADAG